MKTYRAVDGNMPNERTVRTTKAYRETQRSMKNATTLEQFFELLTTLLKTPNRKVFKVTEFDAKTGQPVTGHFEIDAGSIDSDYKFSQENLSKLLLGEDILTHLIDNVQGVCLVNLRGGTLAIRYESVVTYADHFGTEHKTMMVARIVKSTLSFGEMAEEIKQMKTDPVNALTERLEEAKANQN